MFTKVRPTYYDNQRYDPRMLEHMTYKNNISDPVIFQTDPPEVQYDIERKYIVIASQFRDRSQYPNPAHFRIQFPEPFRDVVSIELSGGVLPNKGNISGDGYILLDIPELNHIQGADGNKYFGILGIQYHQNRDYYNLDKANTHDMPVVFKPVKSRFESMTIMLRHPDGSLVQFGSENPDTPADFTIQAQFTFEIRTRVRRRTGIDRDSRALPPII